MDEVGCPRCKSTKYRYPSLKLMVNVCGHTLCENCVELFFARGSGQCQECGIALRRNNFRVQLFEDAYVEKEIDIRRRILRDYNKKESDYATLREYNDYLEEVETIIFNQVNGIAAEETKQKIEQYKRDNQQYIKKNRLKMSKDEEFLERLIEEEREEHLFTQEMLLEQQHQLQKLKQKQKNELIDDLMFSELPADHILQRHRKEALTTQELLVTAQEKAQATKFSSGLSWKTSREPFIPIRTEPEVLYNYSEPEWLWKGPSPPSLDDIIEFKCLTYVRNESKSERAGGFLSQVACQRALQDAFCGLYYWPLDGAVGLPKLVPKNS